MFIQPFPLYFDCNDYHVMLYFKNHPEYESVEAMIQEQNEGDPFIRIIITRLDQTQVDHINNQEYVDRLKIKKRKREFYYTPIHYDRSQNSKGMHIVLKFTSFKGESVCFDFYTASKAESKYTGLIDPGGHSMKISLPVMYPERGMLAGPKSSITINETKYKIPVKVWIPLFFKGMKGYFSEIFNIGVFRAGTEEIKLVNAPKIFKTGEKWIYESESEVSVYKIEEIKEGMLIVRKDNEEIEAEYLNGSCKIKRITLFSSTRQSSSMFSVEFEPSLPVEAVNDPEENNETRFSISIGQHYSLVEGKVNVKQTDKSTTLILIPGRPEWTVKRPVYITIMKCDELFVIKTTVGKE